MTVTELINRLAEFDGNMSVILVTKDGVNEISAVVKNDFMKTVDIAVSMNEDDSWGDDSW